MPVAMDTTFHDRYSTFHAISATDRATIGPPSRGAIETMQYAFFTDREAIWVRLQIFISLGLTALAFWLAHFFRDFLPDRHGPPLPFQSYLELLYLAIPIWFLLLEKSGLYRDFVEKTPLGIVLSVTRVVAMGVGFLIFYIYFLRRLDIMGRLLLAIFAALDATFLVGWHLLLFSLVRRWPVGGFHRRRILVAGTGPEAREMIRALEGARSRVVSVVGVLSTSEGEPVGLDANGSQTFEGKPVMGRLEDLSTTIRNHVVDEVIFAYRDVELGRLRDHLMTCELAGVQARIKSNLHGSLIAKTRIDEIAGMQLLSFSTIPQAPWQLFFKDVFDRLGALLLLVLFSPVLAVVAIAVRLTSEGPILFSQTRCGLNGRRFVFYKFRTMVAGAEEMRAALDGMNEMDGPVFKIREDPRVTPLGAFLRRYSLDELPQLWNVLLGEMSLVGPRPAIPAEIERYKPWQRRRLSMKPGLTCLWQVSGRNSIPFERWMELDLQYIDRWSLKLDLRILLRTIPAVVTARGAC